jgi:hypothetical protein
VTPTLGLRLIGTGPLLPPPISLSTSEWDKVVQRGFSQLAQYAI